VFGAVFRRLYGQKTMNYFLNNELRSIQVKTQGQPGAGAIPASQPSAGADRSRPRIGLEHISFHDRYTTDPACIRDRYAMEHRWVVESQRFSGVHSNQSAR